MVAGSLFVARLRHEGIDTSFREHSSPIDDLAAMMHARVIVRAAPVSSHFSELAAVLIGMQVLTTAPSLSPQVRAAPVSSHFSELAAVLSGVQLVAFAAPRQASGEMISPREMRLASGEMSGNATGGAHHGVSGGAHQPVSWFVQHGLLNATYLDIEQYLPEGKY